MRLKRTVLIFVAASALGFGCKEPAPSGGGAPSASASATPTATATATASATADKAANKPPRRKHRGGMGPTAMIIDAAQDVAKDDKKTKIDDLEKSLKGDDASPRDEMKALQATLIAGIKAGKLDTAKVEADQAAVEKAMKGRKEKEAEVLNAVYGLLEPAQRTTVVAAVREQVKKRDEKMQKWKEKDKADKEKDKGKGNKKLEHLTKDLDLDAAQQKKVEGILPKDDPKTDGPSMYEEGRKRMDALLAAFEKEGFDAKKLMLDDGKDTAMRDHGLMSTKFLSQLLPILKPEQREKLADKMSKMGGPHGGKKGPPNGPAPAPSGAPSGAPSAGPGDDDDD